MTEIERKALALVNEVRASHGLTPYENLYATPAAIEALCRAIEQHEAFKREVSDVCSDVRLNDGLHKLDRFIIANPDPLVEAWIEATGNTVGMEPLNEAIEKRGGKIVWGEGE